MPRGKQHHEDVAPETPDRRNFPAELVEGAGDIAQNRIAFLIAVRIVEHAEVRHVEHDRGGRLAGGGPRDEPVELAQQARVAHESRERIEIGRAQQRAIHALVFNRNCEIMRDRGDEFDFALVVCIGLRALYGQTADDFRRRTQRHEDRRHGVVRFRPIEVDRYALGSAHPLFGAITPDDAAGANNFERTRLFFQPDVRRALDDAVIVKVFDGVRSIGPFERDKDDRCIDVIRQHFAQTLEELAQREVRCQQ
ncbi:MAG TPA: hypothetical protein VJP85_01575 [Candidatus Baltobacteraceae bacterium]|nr:hypothetical protein [Candidatus Baltobacteraceae bacterium]